MRILLRVLLITTVIILMVGGWYGKKYLLLATGFNAKTYCSCHFVSQRTDCLENDLEKFSYLSHTLDEKNKKVRVNIFGFLERVAVYRTGLGCTLLPMDSEKIVTPKHTFYTPERAPSNLKFPLGDSWFIYLEDSTVNYTILNKAIEAAFSEPQLPLKQETRTVMVYYKGKIIASKFKEGFNESTMQLGWSMTKSIAATLAGLMIQDGIVSIDQPINFPEWQKDKRSSITLRNLLNMSSGLYFEEQYHKPSLTTQMLFNSEEMSLLPSQQDLVYEPGSFFYYSSGTTNMMVKFLSDELQKKGLDPISYLNNRLFKKIGMDNTLIELDPSGYMAGSSYGYASALDWLRFGILHLNKGNWNGEQILRAEWVSYISTPTPSCDSAAYGGHFWLNASFNANGSGRRWPHIPSDIYFPSGHAGQHVFIIPSLDLVILRLGNASEKKAWSASVFLRKILAAFPKQNI